MCFRGAFFYGLLRSHWESSCDAFFARAVPLLEQLQCSFAAAEPPGE